jgi:hypothetical protein
VRATVEQLTLSVHICFLYSEEALRRKIPDLIVLSLINVNDDELNE